MDESEFDELMRHQNIMMRSVANESETDSKISMMDIVNDLVTDRNRKVQKEAVLVEAEMRGISESEANRLLEAMKEDNMIIEPEPGYIKRA
jgi:DNA replicative helicase MCM subunit Mcm2 (Cdc46/Mcm family)